MDSKACSAMRDPERIEQAGARQLAVGGEDSLIIFGMRLILTSGPHVSSNGGGQIYTSRRGSNASFITSPFSARQLTHLKPPTRRTRRVTGCSAQPRPRQ